MSKVITFSRTYPAYHYRKGQPTFFVEQMLNSMGIDYWDTPYLNILRELNKDIPSELIDKFCMHLNCEIKAEKHHTIREGRRFEPGELFSPRVWISKPYRPNYYQGKRIPSQLILAPDTEVVQVLDLKYQHISRPFVTHKNADGFDESYPEGTFDRMALNDGFVNREDLEGWLLGGKGWSPVFKGQIICWNENVSY